MSVEALRHRADGHLISTQHLTGAAAVLPLEAVAAVAAFGVLRTTASSAFAWLLVALVILVVRAGLLARRFAVLHLEALRGITTIAVLEMEKVRIGMTDSTFFYLSRG